MAGPLPAGSPLTGATLVGALLVGAAPLTGALAVVAGAVLTWPVGAAAGGPGSEVTAPRPLIDKSQPKPCGSSAPASSLTAFGAEVAWVTSSCGCVGATASAVGCSACTVLSGTGRGIAPVVSGSGSEGASGPIAGPPEPDIGCCGAASPGGTGAP
jgi:hypothetical protein